MVVARGVKKRPAAPATEGMRNQTNFFAATKAKTLFIPTEDPLSAEATTRRVEPI
jgi:hypothetical protein